MTDLRSAAGVLAGLIAVVVSGCSTAEKPAATPDAGTTTVAAAATTAVPSQEPRPAAPTGIPVGTATMQVLGSGPATIHYQINGGPEQTETNVTLPWEKEYDVYDKIESSVTAEGADGCSIIMDGMLASFKNEPNPTCSFAYYG